MRTWILSVEGQLYNQITHESRQTWKGPENNNNNQEDFFVSYFMIVFLDFFFVFALCTYTHTICIAYYIFIFVEQITGITFVRFWILRYENKRFTCAVKKIRFRFVHTTTEI